MKRGIIKVTFIHLIHLFIPSLSHSFDHSFVRHSFIPHFLIHLFPISSFTYSFIHSFIQSLFPWLMYLIIIRTSLCSGARWCCWPRPRTRTSRSSSGNVFRYVCSWWPGQCSSLGLPYKNCSVTLIFQCLLFWYIIFVFFEYHKKYGVFKNYSLWIILIGNHS